MESITPFTRTRFKDSWLPQEAELLLDTYQKNQPIRVYMPDNPNPVYTSIIGFDLTASELLLDGFHPCSQFDVRLLQGQPEPVFLQISGAGNRNYVLKALVTGVDSLTRDYQVSVNILSTHTSSNKRLMPRISFADRQGPAVRISPPWQPTHRGYLCDISQYGCMLKVPGSDIRKHFLNASRKKGQTRISIEFNEQFKLETDCQVRQTVFKRQPCCHNLLRVMFQDLEGLHREQLKAFVSTLSNQPLDIFAA